MHNEIGLIIFELNKHDCWQFTYQLHLTFWRTKRSRLSILVIFSLNMTIIPGSVPFWRPSTLGPTQTRCKPHWVPARASWPQLSIKLYCFDLGQTQQTIMDYYQGPYSAQNRAHTSFQPALAAGRKRDKLWLPDYRVRLICGLAASRGRADDMSSKYLLYLIRGAMFEYVFHAAFAG